MSTRTSTLRVVLLAGVASLGLAATASAQQKSGNPTGAAATTDSAAAPSPMSKAGGSLSHADQKFLEKAAQGGMAEVETGELAQQKASNDAVKQFGARMAKDHGKANEDLKQLAGSKGVRLPASPDRSHMQDMQKLQKASGAKFDREYMQHMVDDHKKDVAEFEKQAKSAHDPDIKAFAAKTLPTLQDHLKQAQSVNDSVKASKTGSGSKSGTTSG